MSVLYNKSARFGKRMELELMSKMLLEGLDVYTPLVDDHGVDCVVKKYDGTFIEVQIKARSNEVSEEQAAFFPHISHEPTNNFYFVFYSEWLESMWIMTSSEFLEESYENKSGKNIGTHGIKFNGCRINQTTGKKKCFARRILKSIYVRTFQNSIE